MSTIDEELQAELKQYIASVEAGEAEKQPEQTPAAVTETKPDASRATPVEVEEQPEPEEETKETEPDESDSEAESDEDDDIEAIVKRKVDAEPEDLPANVRKKIDREVAKRKAADEEKERLRAQLQAQADELRRYKGGHASPAAEPTHTIPIDDLTLSPIEAARKVRQQELAAEKEAQEIAAANRELKKLAEHARDCAEAFAEQVPDYNETVSAVLLPVLNDRADLMVELARTKNFAEIAYFLSQPKQKQLLRELTELTPDEVIRKVARLDERFNIAAAKASKSVAPKAKPLTKTGSGASATKRVEDMDPGEFEKWFKSQ